MSSNSPRCFICKSNNLLSVDSNISFVSSDCRQIPYKSDFLFCENCSFLQKRALKKWKENTSEIYNNYELYSESKGREQKVFNQNKGSGKKRSSKICQKLNQNFSLTSTGKILDVGTGNGAFTSSFKQICPGWEFYLQDKYATKDELISINSEAKRIYEIPPREIVNNFDFISLIHVLEHLTTPLDFIQNLYGLLNTKGIMLIQVPFYLKNPFDLTIYDHAGHYAYAAIKSLIKRANIRGGLEFHRWIPGELTVVIQKSTRTKTKQNNHGDLTVQEVRTRLQWLNQCRKKFSKFFSEKPTGIFGTSIAGTWLFQELNNEVDFFVDEDSSKVGKSRFGKPVLSPREVEKDAKVFMPFSPDLAAQIKSRLVTKMPHLDKVFILPPE